VTHACSSSIRRRGRRGGVPADENAVEFRFGTTRWHTSLARLTRPWHHRMHQLMLMEVSDEDDGDH
jgi:hypothetical protein